MNIKISASKRFHNISAKSIFTHFSDKGFSGCRLKAGSH